MTICSTVSKVSTLLAVALATTATATAQPLAPKMAATDLNLEAELHRTGQVAVPDLYGEGNGILTSTSIKDGPETRVLPVSASPPTKALARISLRNDPTLAFQFGKAFAASVEECRFDAARRGGIAPAKIAAGTITLRWTIEPSGHVRDISAIAWSPTDAAVTACAKRLVAIRMLLNPVETPLALEWTYTFRKMPAQESPNEL